MAATSRTPRRSGNTAKPSADSDIDRLWAEWACSRDKDWGALPSRDWFEARPWFFHDFDLSVKNEQRLHYVQHRSLGIRYQGEDPSCVPLQLPPDIVGPVVAAAAARVRPSELTIHVVPFDLLTPRGNTAPLRRPDAIRIKGFRIVTMSRL
jgi:hypothetical protein